jgi:hypothetical protein
MDSTSLLVLMGVIAIYLLNGLFRKGSLRTTHAHYSETFFTDLPPNRTFKVIIAFATQNGYQIDNFDEQRLAVILNERMTWKSYGFLYPIYVHEKATRTMVEVGVTSKLGKVFLISPFIKKDITVRLEHMLNALKGAVSAYEGTDEDGKPG